LRPHWAVNADSSNQDREGEYENSFEVHRPVLIYLYLRSARKRTQEKAKSRTFTAQLSRVFSPSHSEPGELSGWYLSYVYDPVRDGSDLVSIIIDASDFRGKPVARMQFPQCVPTDCMVIGSPAETHDTNAHRMDAKLTFPCALREEQSTIRESGPRPILAGASRQRYELDIWTQIVAS